MASSFPGAIDSFTNPLASSPLNSPSHAAQHQDINDAVNKIETYMGLVFVKSKLITSATSATDLDDCFSSLYTNYKVMYSFEGNTTGYVEMRLRTTGSLDTSPWYSNCTRTQANSTTATVSNFNGNTAFIVTDGLTQTTRGSIELYNPQTASNAYANHQSSGLGATAYQYTGGTYHSSASSFTGLRFFSSSAGFTFTGTITVFGYRK